MAQVRVIKVLLCLTVVGLDPPEAYPRSPTGNNFRWRSVPYAPRDATSVLSLRSTNGADKTSRIPGLTGVRNPQLRLHV